MSAAVRGSCQGLSETTVQPFDSAVQQEKGRAHARPDRVLLRDIYEREVPPPKDRKPEKPSSGKTAGADAKKAESAGKKTEKAELAAGGKGADAAAAAPDAAAAAAPDAAAAAAPDVAAAAAPDAAVTDGAAAMQVDAK